MLISVIIPAHNEEEYIGANLRSIFNQDYKREDIEIIVVADSCTDRTIEVASFYQSDLTPHQFLTEIGAGLILEVNYRNLSKVRNAGAFRARGITLFFMDADSSLLSPDCLSIIAETVAKEWPRPVFGTFPGIPDKNNWKGAGSGVLFIPRWYFHYIGGFNEEKTLAEWNDLVKRAIKSWPPEQKK